MRYLQHIVCLYKPYGVSIIQIKLLAIIIAFVSFSILTLAIITPNVIANLKSKLHFGGEKKSLGIDTKNEIQTNSCNLPVFTEQIVSPGDINPDSGVTSDFDGDGTADIAVLNYKSNVSSIAIFIGSGEGKFTFLQDISLNGTASTLLVSDFNQDGQPDLIAFDHKGRLYLLLGRGRGNFAQPTVFSIPEESISDFTIADVNQDTYPDLILAQNESLSLFTGSKTNGLNDPHPLKTGLRAKSLTTLDVNFDQKVDLAILAEDEDLGVIILKGDGAGGFTWWSAFHAVGENNRLLLRSGDFNGDAIPDLVAIYKKSNQLRAEISLGDKDGNFVNWKTFAIPGQGLITFTIADFNQDQKQDILAYVVQSYAVKPVTVAPHLLLGDGKGQLGGAISPFLEGGLSIPQLITGDFVRDSKIDFVISIVRTNFEEGFTKKAMR